MSDKQQKNSFVPYEPFGEEWRKELMKMYKTHLVDTIKEMGRENVELKNENQHYQGKILKWYSENGRDPKFAEFFGIQSAREGIIKPKKEEKNGK